MSATVRLCVNCFHHKEVPDAPQPGHMCMKRIADPVTGHGEFWIGPLCRMARAQECGPDARYFEEIPF